MDIVNLVIKVNKKVKANFYEACYGVGITPMRAILILMERFSNGLIDAMPIISAYKAFKEQDGLDRHNRILRYRISGKKAHRINKKAKKALDL